MDPKLYEKLYGMRIRLLGGFILLVAGVLVAALALGRSPEDKEPATPKPMVADTTTALSAPSPSPVPSPVPAVPPVVEPASTTAVKAAAAPKPEIHSYEVRRGDCVWRIAANHCGDGLHWREIYRANRDKIRNPDLIYPAQTFTIPCEP